MREYIFTKLEEEGLVNWLRDGELTKTTVKTLSRIRRAHRLAVHIELMALALRKMKAEGRLLEHLRLPSRSGSGNSG